MPLLSLLDAGVRTETRSRLAGFQPDLTRRWGTLSPGGAVGHLALAYEMAAGFGTCSERTGLLQRSVLRYLALHAPVPWPRGYPTLPELVEGAPGVRSQGFAPAHARLLAAYDLFFAADLDTGRAHPIFGPLTGWEWMRWGYLHADHHLRQFGL
jgi:hypothetical protein